MANQRQGLCGIGDHSQTIGPINMLLISDTRSIKTWRWISCSLQYTELTLNSSTWSMVLVFRHDCKVLLSGLKIEYYEHEKHNSQLICFLTDHCTILPMWYYLHVARNTLFNQNDKKIFHAKRWAPWKECDLQIVYSDRKNGTDTFCARHFTTKKCHATSSVSSEHIILEMKTVSGKLVCNYSRTNLSWIFVLFKNCTYLRRSTDLEDR